jgi:adhesin transport system membrane fusion protein
MTTVNRLDALVAKNPMPGWRVAALTVAGLIAVALIWGAFARLDEVSVAPGEVVPQGQVKTIQHLEGGIIQQINVAEGDTVTKDVPLVQLELGISGTNREELEVQNDGLALRRLRLVAEANGRPVEFPKEIAPRLRDVMASERDAYESRRRQFESSLAVLQSQTQQKTLDIRALDAKRAATEGNLKRARERLDISAGLLKSNLVPRTDHLQLEAEVENLAGQLLEIQAQIPKEREALSGLKEQERFADLKFRRDAADELGQVDLAIARNRELLTKATDQERRTVIRSPIDGVVKNLRYHTVGGVVRAGEPIMEIVPLDEKLIVETRLNPIDIGYVHTGQSAVVKITTYDFVRYGGLEGTVTTVAADTSLDRNGAAYYRVVVATDRSYLGDRPGVNPIAPGMQATVDIHTGSKSVLQYLVEPVVKLRHEAFRER